jgi:hypothetical protein
MPLIIVLFCLLILMSLVLITIALHSPDSHLRTKLKGYVINFASGFLGVNQQNYSSLQRLQLASSCSIFF